MLGRKYCAILASCQTCCCMQYIKIGLFNLLSDKQCSLISPSHRTRVPLAMEARKSYFAASLPKRMSTHHKRMTPHKRASHPRIFICTAKPLLQGSTSHPLKMGRAWGVAAPGYLHLPQPDRQVLLTAVTAQLSWSQAVELSRWQGLQ